MQPCMGCVLNEHSSYSLVDVTAFLQHPLFDVDTMSLLCLTVVISIITHHSDSHESQDTSAVHLIVTPGLFETSPKLIPECSETDNLESCLTTCVACMCVCMHLQTNGACML